MKLFLISQHSVRGNDTYDSAVVIADNPNAAKRISPNPSYRWSDEHNCWSFLLFDGTCEPARNRSDWPNRPEDIVVEELGEARSSTAFGVVCASFNAG
jgi:hypothetical protein